MNEKRILLSILCVLALAMSARLFHVHRIQAEASQAYGRFTQQQIIEKTRALSRRIWPQIHGMQYEAECMGFTNIPAVTGTGKTSEPVWFIDCLDDSGRYVGKVGWDADTGNLIQIFCARPSVTDEVRIEMSKQEKVKITQAWLSDLGLNDASQQWRVAKIAATPEVAETKSSKYAVWWESESRSVCISLGSSGELLSVSVKKRVK